MAKEKIILRQLAALLFLFMQLLSVRAQNETANWFFGFNCGLTFNGAAPSGIASPQFNSPEGGASISDANGNLLFYTDAGTIWDQSNAVMANGTGLLGNPSSSQSAIIIKQPGSATNYFIFTMGSALFGGELRYSSVDMSLAAGAGSVTVKNVLLYASSCEKLHAVKHCNGTDAWIVSHDFYSGSFRSYLLTASGVNPSPVLSSIGSTYGSGNTSGCLKISPNGKKLACTTFLDKAIELFDFDAATGILSNSLSIPTGTVIVYGLEFSPDGTKLYGGSVGDNQLLQWDLCAGNDAAVVSTSVSIPTAGFVGSIQLAKNGKVYFSELNRQQLSVINSPNNGGVACNVSLLSQPVGTGTLQFGLPNFMASYFNEPIPFPYTQNCSVVDFTVPGSSCSAIKTYTSVAWSFGDTGSGLLNTSNLVAVTHTFSAPGTYTVKLVMHSPCGKDSVSRVIGVQGLTLSNNLVLCAGHSATLQAGGADVYNWSTGVAGSTLEISPGSTTSYTVTGSYTNGCAPNSSVVTVSVMPSPTLTVSGLQSICRGDQVILTASGSPSYSWNTGATTSTITGLPAADITYTVTGEGNNGCTSSKTFSITVRSLPALSINAQTICAGQSVTLTNLLPNAGASYTWEPGGATTESLNAAPPATTLYTLTALLNGCRAALLSTVTVIPVTNPVTSFSYAPACVTGDAPVPVQAMNFSFGGSYTSNPMLFINSVSGLVTPDTGNTGSFVITYALAAHNCVTAGTQTALLVMDTPPVLTVSPDIKIGPGESATLSVSGGESYNWVPALDISCSDCAQPVVVPAQNTQYCVIATNKQCTTKSCVNVAVNCEGGDLSLPNAFSPNGDGFNDSFCLQGWDLCLVKFTVAIFNRWGDKVFESSDPSFCWDGSFHGKTLDTDVLAYIISASYSTGLSVNKKGNITLLR